VEMYAENMFFAYNTMYTISHHVFHFNLSVLLNDKQKLSNYIILTVDKKKKTETKMNHWKICIDILVPILTNYLNIGPCQGDGSLLMIQSESNQKFLSGFSKKKKLTKCSGWAGQKLLKMIWQWI
jgi:hypothetical protein